MKEVYLIDTETLDLSICFEEDIIARLNSGELIYEKEKHKLSGIDKHPVINEKWKLTTKYPLIYNFNIDDKFKSLWN